MNNRATLSEMHNQYMKVYNLLRLAEATYPEGPDRDAAYSVVAAAYGNAADTFMHIK